MLYPYAMTKNFKQKLQNVNTFIFDIDGVLTNGSLIVMPQELHRIMNIRDGYALREAVLQGYHVAVISGGKSESVRWRLQNLGITEIHLGIEDKKEKLEELMYTYDLNHESILYMGDDIPDYEVMKKCGVPCAPADAAPEIKAISIYISTLKGGEGCVRDVIEQTLRLHNKWFQSE